MVGIIKTFITRTLHPKHFSVVGRLLPGQRTPCFAIEMANTTVFVVLARADGRKLDHVLAGVIRLEARRPWGWRTLLAIRRIFLPRRLLVLVSRPASHPRAPQI